MYFYLLLAILSVSFAVYMIVGIFRPTKTEKEVYKKIEENLEDEFITDPETGVRLTLEQAESGHWINHTNEFSTTPESEIEKLYTEEQKDAERAVNYLKGQTIYRKQKLQTSEIEFLGTTKILSKYEDWSYSDSFRMEYCTGYVFLPAVFISGPIDYNESQVMFWIKLKENFGHYYLREKSSVEKFFDLIKSNDDLKLSGYESFTFEKTETMIPIMNILKRFENQKGLEIEFIQNNLLVKNNTLINQEDILRIEKIMKNVC